MLQSKRKQTGIDQARLPSDGALQRVIAGHNATMISQFFILSPRGDTIIMRDYLGNVPKVHILPKIESMSKH